MPNAFVVEVHPVQADRPVNPVYARVGAEADPIVKLVSAVKMASVSLPPAIAVLRAVLENDVRAVPVSVVLARVVRLVSLVNLDSVNPLQLVAVQLVRLENDVKVVPVSVDLELLVKVMRYASRACVNRITQVVVLPVRQERTVSMANAAVEQVLPVQVDKPANQVCVSRQHHNVIRFARQEKLVQVVCANVVPDHVVNLAKIVPVVHVDVEADLHASQDRPVSRVHAKQAAPQIHSAVDDFVKVGTVPIVSPQRSAITVLGQGMYAPLEGV